MREFPLILLIIQLVIPGYTCTFTSTNVQISDSGYTGLVIAINDDVEENATLINAIKKTWTEASEVLYRATENRTCFKQITILLPKTWEAKGYENVKGNENSNEADVAITLPDETNNNMPYTRQPGGCGVMASKMYFTSQYLTWDIYERDYGSRGKVVVRNWARYRWGVFEETSEESPFYWRNTEDARQNGPSATKCPRDLFGFIARYDEKEDYKLKICTLDDIDRKTDVYRKDCQFRIPDDMNNDINVSLMSHQYLPQVSEFCKDEDEVGESSKNFHDIFPPNRQNRLCGMQSVWSVIRQSPDFSRWGSSNTMTDIVPKFDIVVARKYSTFVLILDDSGSMKGKCGDGTKTECLLKAAYHFINLAAKCNSYMGVVAFGSTANIVSSLTDLSSPQDEERMVNSLLPLNGSSGSTCIGCGIEKGIQVLTSQVGAAAGAKTVIITDGEENEDPRVSAVAEEVKRQGIIVDTVFIETEGNADLKQLSDATKGKTYFGKTQGDLDEILSQITQSDGCDDVSSRVASDTFDSTGLTTHTSTVNIDGTIGRNTIFAFTWSLGSTAPNIYIQSPSGCYYSNNFESQVKCPLGDTSHTVRADFRIIQFVIPDFAEVGEWIVTVKNSAGVGLMTSSVSSSRRSNTTKAIFIESGMAQTQINHGPATIYVRVTQGNIPVVGATIVAKVSGAGGISKEVTLFDNGAGADVNKYDGVYSRYFTEFTGSGRYSVKVKVTDGPEVLGVLSPLQSRAAFNPGFIAADGSLYTNAAAATLPVTGPIGIQSRDIGTFSRVISSESFDYSGPVDVTVGGANDIFPPGKIIDARLSQVDLTDFKKGLELRFTAPGDDYDVGTAFRYEMRYSFKNFKRLATDFDIQKQINQTSIVEGNLTNPSEAGTADGFTIQLPELPTDENGNTKGISYLGISIKAYDEAGNSGEPSNVPVVSFFIDPVVFSPPSTTEDEKAAIEIWWIIVAALGAVAIIGVVFLCWRYKVRNRPKCNRMDEERNETTAQRRSEPRIYENVMRDRTIPGELQERFNGDTQRRRGTAKAKDRLYASTKPPRATPRDQNIYSNEN